MKKSKHHFSADLPITDKSQDLLRRNSFVQDLVKSISGWRESESLVVSVYGSWGDGKTSLKNLLKKEFLSVQNSPVFLEFNPWQWGDENNLTKAFFNELIVVMSLNGNAKRKELVGLLKKYLIYLELSKELAEKTKVYIDSGLKTASGLAGVSALSFEEYRLQFLVAAGCLYAFSQASSIVIDVFTWINKYLNVGIGGEKPLNEQKEIIKQKLREINEQFVIVIDDIDRLKKEEIRSLFKLIKANADFPNIVYLTFFQRDIVEKALDEDNFKGEEYLKKIIQIGFNLPKVSPDSVHKILFSKLDETLKETELQKNFESGRWRSVFNNGGKHYFENLRDVNRFYSTFQFHLALFNVKGTYEVNFVDYFGLEVLRVFEGEVFGHLHDFKSEFTSSYSGSRYSKDEEEKTKLKIQNLIEMANNKSATEAILKELFPNLSWVWSNGYRGIWDEDFINLRINHPDRFDLYFSLQLIEGQIPLSEINNFLNSLDDYEALRNTLVDYYNKGTLVDFLDSLSNYKKRIVKKHIFNFLDSMLFAGDMLKKKDTVFDDPMVTIERIIHWAFHERRISYKKLKYLILLESSEAVYLPLKFLYFEISRGEEKRYPSHYIFSSFDKDHLISIFKNKIQKVQNSAVFKNSSYLPRMIGVWSAIDKTSSEKWLLGYIADDLNFVSFFERMLSISMSSTGHDTKTSYFLGLKQLEELFTDLPSVFQRVHDLKQAGAVSVIENRNLLSAFAVAEKLYSSPTKEDFDGFRVSDNDDEEGDN